MNDVSPLRAEDGAAPPDGSTTPTGLQSTAELNRRRWIVTGLNVGTWLLLNLAASAIFGAGGWTIVDVVLAIAFAITSSILIAEVIGAVITGSLALLVDAAHMLVDAGGLLLALLAALAGVLRLEAGYVDLARFGVARNLRPAEVERLFGILRRLRGRDSGRRTPNRPMNAAC